MYWESQFPPEPVREPKTPEMVLPMPPRAPARPPTESARPGMSAERSVTVFPTPFTPFWTTAPISAGENSHLPLFAHV